MTGFKAIAFLILLFLVISYFAAPNANSATTATAPSSKASKDPNVEVVTFRYDADAATKFYGFKLASDSKFIADKQAVIELRCADRAWGIGKTGERVYWEFREIFVPDENGPTRKRADRNEAPNEKGYGFLFDSYEQCDRATPTLSGPGTKCGITLELNKKTRKARFLAKRCDVPGNGSPSATGAGKANGKETTAQ